MVRAQRVRDGGSRIEMQIVKWTAEGAVKGRCKSMVVAHRAEYSATWRHTSVAGNMKVFRQAHGSCRESRWHRG